MSKKKDSFTLAMDELDACKKLVRQYERITLTAPVDDDFPQVKYEYDQAVTVFVDAANANRGRGLSIQYVATVNLQRCLRWHPAGINSWSASDWAVALAGEVGELCNVVKKMNRQRDGLQQKAVDADLLQSMLADEIGDVFAYLDLFAQAAGLNLEECIRNKFNKISEREGFPERL